MFKQVLKFTSNGSFPSIITGICAICPNIAVYESTFCFTGDFKKYSQKEAVVRIIGYGGFFKEGLSNLVDYLVVGANGSKIWTYSCYGRKIERAISMRKDNHRIQIIHDFDLWDYFEEAA